MPELLSVLETARTGRVILDVGANDGLDGLVLAAQNPDCHVYAFEPTPQMISLIETNYRRVYDATKIRNYTLVPCAVSDFIGTAKFNVSGCADWGCSSLYSFAPEVGKHWPGRRDLTVTETIEVDVITLGAFCERAGVLTIEYLHCDTQGSDLRVIAGLGSNIELLRRGVLETATSRRAALYKGQDLLEDVLPELKRWGYVVDRISHNDQWCNEVNVYFSRPGFSAADQYVSRSGCSDAQAIRRLCIESFKERKSRTRMALRLANRLYQLPVRLAKSLLNQDLR